MIVDGVSTPLLFLFLFLICAWCVGWCHAPGWMLLEASKNVSPCYYDVLNATLFDFFRLWIRWFTSVLFALKYAFIWVKSNSEVPSLGLDHVLPILVLSYLVPIAWNHLYSWLVDVSECPFWLQIYFLVEIMSFGWIP